jgi:hypothetical protein
MRREIRRLWGVVAIRRRMDDTAADTHGYMYDKQDDDEAERRACMH